MISRDLMMTFELLSKSGVAKRRLPQSRLVIPRVGTVPDNSGHSLTIPGNSEEVPIIPDIFRTVPDNSGQLRTVSDNSGQIRTNTAALIDFIRLLESPDKAGHTR